MAKSGWVQAFFGFFLEGGEGEWKIEGARAEFYFFFVIRRWVLNTMNWKNGRKGD